MPGYTTARMSWKTHSHRQAHLDGLAAQKQAGVLDYNWSNQGLNQSLWLYEARDEAAVRQIIEADPYWQNGVWQSTL